MEKMITVKVTLTNGKVYNVPMKFDANTEITSSKVLTTMFGQNMRSTTINVCYDNEGKIVAILFDKICSIEMPDDVILK